MPVYGWFQAQTGSQISRGKKNKKRFDPTVGAGTIKATAVGALMGLWVTTNAPLPPLHPASRYSRKRLKAEQFCPLKRRSPSRWDQTVTDERLRPLPGLLKKGSLTGAVVAQTSAVGELTAFSKRSAAIQVLLVSTMMMMTTVTHHPHFFLKLPYSNAALIFKPAAC